MTYVFKTFSFISWNVGYGSNSITSLRYIESTVAFIHPSFNAVNSNNNLGVIVLPSALPSGKKKTVHKLYNPEFILNFPDSVRPIALPTANDGTFPRMNQEGRLVGFGIIDETKVANPAPTQFLKTIYLTVRSNDECISAFPSVDSIRNFCADDLHPGSTNVCHGDVGSAFVVTNRGQKILVSRLKVRKRNLLCNLCYFRLESLQLCQKDASLMIRLPLSALKHTFLGSMLLLF